MEPKLLIRHVVLSACAAVLSVLLGCTTRHREFAGHQADAVWAAMKHVAEHPTPHDWFVLENNVWIDDDSHRIEVDRFCRRERSSPMSRPMMETRKWAFTIRLKYVDPPTVEFVARNFGVPAHAWEEADRFFLQLSDVLQNLGAVLSTSESGELPAQPEMVTPIIELVDE